MMTLTVAKKRRHSRRWMERATLFLTTCCLFVGSAFSYTTTTLSVDPAYPDATLHIPAGYVGAPTQLVLMLHGYDSDGAGHESYFQFLSLIDSRGFLYAHPDGRLNTSIVAGIGTRTTPAASSTAMWGATRIQSISSR